MTIAISVREAACSAAEPLRAVQGGPVPGVSHRKKTLQEGREQFSKM
ncbi:MAG: hypothetical protein IT425_11785 [Pirellulales bacterium]|nr:hypothetical protein [Pirellulales bacterium]